MCVYVCVYLPSLSACVDCFTKTCSRKIPANCRYRSRQHLAVRFSACSRPILLPVTESVRCCFDRVGTGDCESMQTSDAFFCTLTSPDLQNPFVVALPLELDHFILELKGSALVGILFGFFALLAKGQPEFGQGQNRSEAKWTPRGVVGKLVRARREIVCQHLAHRLT